MSKERRSTRRLSISLDVMFRHMDQEKSYTAGVVDVSFSGICITSPEPFSPGEFLELKVGLETGEMVFLAAQVRWLSNNLDGKSFRIGLRFVKGRDDDLAKFERYYNLRVLYPPLEH